MNIGSVFRQRRVLWLVVTSVGIAVVGAIPIYRQGYAATQTLSPNADVVSNWSAQGTGDGTCGAPLCDRIDDPPASPDTSRYIRSTLGGNIAQFDTTTFPTERGATGITVHIYVRNAAIVGSLADDINVRVDMPGGNTAAQQVQITNAGWQWRQFSWTGTYSQNDIDNMRPRFQQIMRRDCFLNLCTGDDTLDIATMYVTTTYTPYNDLDQSAYRVYQNADSASPGAPVGSTNQLSDIPGKGSAFRLRMLATVSVNQFLTGEFSYRLQVGERITSCAAASYSDVTTSTGPIRFFDNPGVGNAVAAGSSANNPVSANAITLQTYHENNPIGSFQNAPQGNDILWDFALYDADTTPNQVYCFRLVYNDGAPLEGYSSYPEVRTVGDLVTSVVDTNEQPIVDPGVDMSLAVVMTECQTSTGVLGTSGERIKITNDLVTNGWGLNIAATAGPTALWSAGTPKFDFNDPAGSPAGCAAGTDSDTYAGQMTINPSSSSITPSSGCSATGVSGSPSASFSEGSSNIIDLVTATSGSERFCDFFVEGVSISQTIPQEIPMGQYSIDMTITIVAF